MTTVSQLESRPVWLAFLPDALFHPAQPGRYIALAWAVSFFPSILLSWLVARLGPGIAQPSFPEGSLALFVAVVIISPLVESVLMGLVIDLLRRWVAPGAAVIASAVGWGVLHSSLAPAWGLVIWWPFLVFSITFVTWRSHGYWQAAGMAAAVHALQNLVPGLVLIAGVN